MRGTGGENYYFSENGIISSNFLDSDILKAALADFKNGNLASGITTQYSFGASELLSDRYSTGTIFSITGLVGSGQITITSEANGIRIKIFNITSLTSGDLFKNPFDDTNWSKSYVRDPNKVTPYGNISQTYNLFLENGKW